MKIAKITLQISVVILISSCSQYAHRMVRVKKENNVVRSEPKTDKKSSDNSTPISSLEAQMQGEFLVEPPVVGTSVTKFKISKVKEVLQESAVAKTLQRIKSNDIVQDTILLDDVEREEIVQKYERANGMTVAALILLLTSPLTFGIGIIGALVLSIIAIRIYFKYKNPGIRERYVLALSVLVGSFLVIALVTGLLFYLAFFW